MGGARYQRDDGGTVVQVFDVEDAPAPEVALMDELGKVPPQTIVLAGLDYPVVISAGDIWIVCEKHPAAQWAAFDDERIAAMDGVRSAATGKATATSS